MASGVSKALDEIPYELLHLPEAHVKIINLGKNEKLRRAQLIRDAAQVIIVVKGTNNPSFG